MQLEQKLELCKGENEFKTENLILSVIIRNLYAYDGFLKDVCRTDD